MRMSRLFLRTLREDPADADVDSHRLLLRAGYIRRVAAGVYTWLPLGRRVLRKVEEIVREEMDAAGAQELLLPIIQPLELWQRTGRDQAYGPLMFTLEDRRETGFCLAPTAEEVIATTVGGEYSSYRDLPVNLYQVGWKYRDEFRPRFGLLRGREFLMKDAYSFDADLDGLRVSYRAMYDAYHRVFTRCGLTFRPVEAQAGEIGGDINHEFMAVAAVGEDDFVWCRACDYAANVEAAVRGPGDLPVAPAEPDAGAPAAQVVHTPGAPGVAAVAPLVGVDAGDVLKSLAFVATDPDGRTRLGLALVPGDRELNEHALVRALRPASVRLVDDFDAHPGLVKGYIGPDAAAVELVVADRGVARPGPWVVGANQVDHHRAGALAGRDFHVDRWDDLVAVRTGDPCPRCGAPLSVDRGIEVGHTFQLGTKYTEALGVNYVDEQAVAHPMVMGCYGIGVSRVVAAVAEEHHDDRGLAWPAALAPYDVHVVVLPGRGDTAGVVVDAAAAVEASLEAAGLAVLVDDRDASPGVKFADADLVGVPVQVTVGAKGVQRGVVELKRRRDGERSDVAASDPAALVAAVRAALS